MIGIYRATFSAFQRVEIPTDLFEPIRFQSSSDSRPSTKNLIESIGSNLSYFAYLSAKLCACVDWENSYEYFMMKLILQSKCGFREIPKVVSLETTRSNPVVEGFFEIHLVFSCILDRGLR